MNSSMGEVLDVAKIRDLGFKTNVACFEYLGLSGVRKV